MCGSHTVREKLLASGILMNDSMTV
jgi:hypothetical protein